MFANTTVIHATPDQITTASTEQLDVELVQLKALATAVSDQIRLSNRAHYEHLAQLYIWWHAANQIPGYLEATYKAANLRNKKNTTQAINFGPLLRLTWGTNNELSDDKVWRWSLVLNRLHTAYEADDYFLTESVTRLADSIGEAGGVDGIVGTSTSANDDDTTSDDDPPGGDAAGGTVAAGQEDMSRNVIAQLFGRATKFYDSASRPSTFSLDTPIPLTDNMGLVLVAKVGNQYQFVRACNDPQYLQQAVADAFLQDYEALPPSVRMFMEMISTQCLPEHLQKLHPKLLERAVSAKAKAITRLMYHHASGTWVFSPVAAKSGVVTITKPHQPLLENATHDAFLLQQDRRGIERRLISPRKFNLYKPSNDGTVPVSSPSGYVVHSLRLQHQYDQADALDLNFLPYGLPMSAPRGQLIPREVTSGKWRATLSRAWFSKFALEFTAKWLGDIAKHLTRKPNQVFNLYFDSAGLTVNYGFRNDVFESNHTVAIDGAVTMSDPVSVHVRSKDFAVAMQAVAELGVTGAIEFEVEADLMMLRFSTTAADYRIFMPTCTVTGERSAAGFTQYEPVLVNVASSDSYSEQIADELSVKAE